MPPLLSILLPLCCFLLVAPPPGPRGDNLCLPAVYQHLVLGQGACEDLSPSLSSLCTLSQPVFELGVFGIGRKWQGGAGLTTGASGQWDKGLEHGGLLGWTSFRCWVENIPSSFSLDMPSVWGCARRPQRVKLSGTFCLTLCVALKAFGCIALFSSLPSLV